MISPEGKEKEILSVRVCERERYGRKEGFKAEEIVLKESKEDITHSSCISILIQHVPILNIRFHYLCLC